MFDKNQRGNETSQRQAESLADQFTDGFDLVFVPEQGPPRKTVFEPLDDGSFSRITKEWNGCVWRATGREHVESVSLETVEGEVFAGGSR